MSSPAQIRLKMADLAKRRADHDRRTAEASAKQAKKHEEAASYRKRAASTTLQSTASSYLRQAASAETAAIAEGKKAAGEAKRSAECSAKEAQLSKDLAAAIAKELASEKRDRDRREYLLKRERERDAVVVKQQYQRELQAERERTAALVAASEARMAMEVSRLREPRKEPLRILYLTASSGGDLRVDEEIRRVKAGVRAATHRELVVIEHMPAATASDLLDGLTRFRPHVVHFSGHASETTLTFDTGADRRNAGQAVAAEVFVKAISAVDRPPTLVVLNACRSGAQLEGLLMVAPVAIGMSKSVGDADAIVFAARFYAAVAEGQSVGASYEIAKIQMELNGLQHADLPVLSSIDSVDPSDVVLVLPAE